MITETERLAFLKTAWLEIIALSPNHVQLHGQSAFVPDNVIAELRKTKGFYGPCTIDELTATCANLGAIEEAFNTVANTLFRDWDRLKASVKATIVSAIKARNLGDHAILSRLKVSAEDELIIRTPWHIVDSLYAARREIALQRIERAGISIRDQRMTTLKPYAEILEIALTELSALYRYHAEVFVALTSAQAVPKSSGLLSLLSTRVRSDWSGTSVYIRNAIREQISFLRRDDPYAQTEHWHIAINERIRSLMEPVDDGIAEVIDTIGTVAPSAESIRQVNELLGAPPMSITITGDGNVVGNNNRVVATINKGVSVRSTSLAEAFALLKGEIAELPVPEKARSKATRAIEDAESEIADTSNTNGSEVEFALKRAKTVLEDAGAVYDQTKGWGQRLFEVGKLLASVIAITLSL